MQNKMINWYIGKHVCTCIHLHKLYDGDNMAGGEDMLQCESVLLNKSRTLNKTETYLANSILDYLPLSTPAMRLYIK